MPAPASGITHQGDRLADLSDLEQRARRDAPHLLPQIEALRASGQASERDLEGLANRLLWARLGRLFRRPPVRPPFR